MKFVNQSRAASYRQHVFILVLCTCLPIVGSQFIFREDPLALLAGTLRTIQRAACDGETLTLRCPLATAVSIQLAQYGRPAPGIALCPGQSSSSTTDMLVVAHAKSQAHNESCALTPSMQHALLQTVVEACVKKRQCKFSTSLKSPEAVVCPNQTKFVEVAYKCRPLEFRSKIICENDTINLKCKRNARIAIYSATFGRIHFQSLQCPQPAGVDEETCEASFSTETVMQVCHGKRRCSLTASSSTFGNPCSPKSHLYLRVVYTCVSRRILKDHYQGELEADESENAMDDEQEDSFESDDSTDPTQVITPPATPAPRNIIYTDYHPKNIAATTTKPEVKKEGFFGNDKNAVTKSTQLVDDVDMMGDISGDVTRHSVKPEQVDNNQHENRNGQRQDPGRVIGIINDWISSVSFLKENQEKLILYLTLSIAAGILVLLTLLIGRLWWQKRRARHQNKLHSTDPIPAFADEVSDVDNDIDLTLIPPPPLNDTSSTSATSSEVRYSNQRTATLGRQHNIDPPRSFVRNGNNHYYYG